MKLITQQLTVLNVKEGLYRLKLNWYKFLKNNALKFKTTKTNNVRTTCE